MENFILNIVLFPIRRAEYGMLTCTEGPEMNKDCCKCKIELLEL